MSVRAVTNRRLAAWQRSGGVRQTVADIVDRGSRNRMVVIGFLIIVFMVALAVLAPVLPLPDPTQQNLDPTKILLPPSFQHPLGTDNLGRDVVSRVIWGARIRNEFEGNVRVMAIMTGVRSAQVLGPYAETAAKITHTPVPQQPAARDAAHARGDRKSGGLIDFI